MRYALPHSIPSGYAQADVLTENQDPFINWTERGGALVEALPGPAEIAESVKQIPPMGWAFGAGVLGGIVMGVKPLILGGVAWALLASKKNGNGAVSGYGREAPGATIQENIEMMKDPEIATSVAERSRDTFITPTPKGPAYPAAQMNLLIAGGVGAIALAGFFLLRKKK
ncbi:MAG TPA: LPXTG cell wall anchor domain-containing protein [Thermoleophilia bacterium]|nr:LPXTG cell wall anchor domain-containing protein [Thermoleophilia bacterium]